MTAARTTPAFGRWDGHCHSAYSGHGSGEGCDAFAARALALGFERLTFAEHPLFPRALIEADLYREIYLDEETLDRYLDTIAAVRERFAPDLAVRAGFEMDFVPGQPDFPLQYLEPRLDRVDDAVLSVHFLPGRGGRLWPVDMDPATVGHELVAYHGGIDGVRRVYWETVEEALERAHAWGIGLPRRLGHLDVIGKFRDAFPLSDPAADLCRAGRVLDRMRDLGWALDLNAKGIDVALRREAYPAQDLLAAAIGRGIELVYGSDAHSVAEVGRYRDVLAGEVAALGGWTGEGA